MKIKTAFTAIVAAIIVLCQIPFMSSAIAAYYQEIPVREVPFPADLNGKEDPATKMLTFTFPDLRAVGILKVVTGSRVYHNTRYQNCWVIGRDYSFIEARFNLSDEDLKRKWYLNLEQLSSIFMGENYSPIAISVNGYDIVGHFDPMRDAWRMDHFKLGHLVAGENTITLSLQDASSNYWIRGLTISPDKQANIRLDTLGEGAAVAVDANKIKDQDDSASYKRGNKDLTDLL